MELAPLLAIGLAVALARAVAGPVARSRRRGGSAGGAPSGRRLAVPVRWAPVVVGIAGLLASGPLAGLALAGVVAGASPVARQVQRRRTRAAVARAVPDLVDLFLVAASAGQPVASGLVVVAPRSPPAVAPAVAAARECFGRGLPLADCLADLGDALGPSGRPLTEALHLAAAAGVPLVPLLEGVAATARDARRRSAQEAARRLPVTMLFPLVCCVLPAAVLVAVVPVLVVSISSLSP